jgi:hypothetical protein
MAAERLPITDGPWRATPDMRPVENRYWMEAFDEGEEYLAGWDIVSEKECVVGCEGIIPGPNAEGDARLMAASRELLDALVGLLRRDEGNTCQHEDTHRGGVLWEICDQCGAMWADDEGGKPEWKDPPEWEAARRAINKALTGE